MRQKASVSPYDESATAAPGGAMADYDATLTQCKVARGPEMLASLLAALQARDRLAQALASAPTLDASTIRAVSALDDRLHKAAARLEESAGVRVLKSIKPAVAAIEGRGWWWDVEALLPRPKLRWTAVAAVLLAGAVALVAEVTRRFFAEGPDVLGAAYIVIQAGVALLAGGTLLETGNGLFQQWLDEHAIRRAWHSWVRVSLAILTLSIAILVFQLLPSAARSYAKAGTNRYNGGRTNDAIQDFRRALSLNPEYAEAHYALGRAYERVIDYDHAIGEYQKALEIQPVMYLAANSLARLYIVHKNSPPAALLLIDNALKLTRSVSAQRPADIRDARLSLLKNRGWANLNAGHLAEARLDLEEGLQIDANRASLHCVLAQLDEKERSTNSLEWDHCLGYSYLADDVESDWLAMAQDRLAAREVVK